LSVEEMLALPPLRGSFKELIARREAGGKGDEEREARMREQRRVDMEAAKKKLREWKGR
jgi:hypothetical protein